MLLKDLIAGYEVLEVFGDTNIDVSSIDYDSRKVTAGSLFVCVEGYKTDGHQYIGMAAEKGATAFIVSQEVEVPAGCVKIRVEDSRDALSFVADKFYAQPSRELMLVGVTGTKGKTTTTYMIKSILELNGSKVGLIGTVANCIGDEIMPAERTTPESLELQGLFREMLVRGADACIMEVSSHALELKRVNFSNFNIGIFTNLSRDHMDFHHTFENYLNAKIKLFNLCEYGIVNVDTEYGKEVVKAASCRLTTVGINEMADIRAIDVVYHKESVEFSIVSDKYNGRVQVGVPGTFTVYNALCALATAYLMDIPFGTATRALTNIKVPGRAEIVDIGRNYTVMIDYAHTPDSLENILTSVKQFARGKLISVFGCGGDRDRTKRPIMGEISGKIADFTVVTSDNPRTEIPISIISEIEAGIKPTGASYITIEDRRAAIKYAMENACEDDVIVIAGKGHETYQQFADKKIDFDERKVVKELSKEIGERM